MQELYKKILETNKSNGCVPIELIVSGSGMLDAVKNKLISYGYDISKLDNRGISILFASLNDILFIVEGDSFYLVTLCKDKIQELISLLRVVRRDDERAYEKTSQIIDSINTPVINKFLVQGKFHFVKLNDIASCRNTIFLCRLGTMSPYPSLTNGEVVYSMENVGAWHNTCISMLIQGLCKINGEYICQNYMARSKSLCTTGNLVTKNHNNEVVTFRLWNIKDIVPYSDNDLTMKLLSGICTYDGVKVTLNREILEKYYGAVLYKKLESEGVRQRYCLEELLSPGGSTNVCYYTDKYGLKIDADSTWDLESKLSKLVSKEHERTDIIHARVLDSAGVFLNGHKSFYKTINLNNVKNHTVEVIEDISNVLPKIYKYTAISTAYGYLSCEVKAQSIDLAMKYGKTEFEREYGDCVKFCSLSCDGKVVKGTAEFDFTIKEQRNICQYIMWGYTNHFAEYYKLIYALCLKNNITWLDENHVKFLLINKIALDCKHARDLNLAIFSSHLYDFFVLISDKANALKALEDEYMNIAVRRAKVEYAKINSKLPDTVDYIIDDTSDGKFITTEYAKFKVLGDRLSKNVQIYYNGKYLGTKQFKEG